MQAMKENERQYLVMDQASFDAFNQAADGSVGRKIGCTI